jgi:hypothetical protein
VTTVVAQRGPRQVPIPRPAVGAEKCVVVYFGKDPSVGLWSRFGKGAIVSASPAATRSGILIFAAPLRPIATSAAGAMI